MMSLVDVLVKAIRRAEAGCEVQGFCAFPRRPGRCPGRPAARCGILRYRDGRHEWSGTGHEDTRHFQPHKNHFVTGYPQYALEAYSIHARGYLLKPPTAENVRSELDELKCPPLHVNGRIRAQTFGNFEIFVDDKPLHFSLSKTKELLAYLVDRRGAAVNTGELCAILWEQRPDSLSVRSHLRTLISDLSRTLSLAGTGDILIKRRNSFAVDCEKLDCDLYGFLRQEPDAINTYMGQYMMQYTWAEMTLGELERQK